MSAPICPRCGSPVRAHSVLGVGECVTRTEALAAAWEREGELWNEVVAGESSAATWLRRCAQDLREATS